MVIEFSIAGCLMDLVQEINMKGDLLTVIILGHTTGRY